MFAPPGAMAAAPGFAAVVARPCEGISGQAEKNGDSRKILISLKVCGVAPECEGWLFPLDCRGDLNLNPGKGALCQTCITFKSHVRDRAGANRKNVTPESLGNLLKLFHVDGIPLDFTQRAKVDGQYAFRPDIQGNSALEMGVLFLEARLQDLRAADRPWLPGAAGADDGGRPKAKAKAKPRRQARAGQEQKAEEKTGPSDLRVAFEQCRLKRNAYDIACLQPAIGASEPDQPAVGVEETIIKTGEEFSRAKRRVVEELQKRSVDYFLTAPANDQPLDIASALDIAAAQYTAGKKACATLQGEHQLKKAQCLVSAPSPTFGARIESPQPDQPICFTRACPIVAMDPLTGDPVVLVGVEVPCTQETFEMKWAAMEYEKDSFTACPVRVMGAAGNGKRTCRPQPLFSAGHPEPIELAA